MKTVLAATRNASLAVGSVVLAWAVTAMPAMADVVDIAWNAAGHFERSLTVAPGKFAEVCAASFPQASTCAGNSNRTRPWTSMSTTTRARRSCSRPSSSQWQRARPACTRRSIKTTVACGATSRPVPSRSRSGWDNDGKRCHAMCRLRRWGGLSLEVKALILVNSAEPTTGTVQRI